MTGRVADGPRLTGLDAARALDAATPVDEATPVDAVVRGGALAIGEVADDEVEAVVALWRGCGLTRPWNDPYRDVADARLGSTSTVLVGRASGGADPVPDGAPRAGEVVATAMAGLDGHRGWLYYVAVDPRLRGTGLGREMVVAAEAWLAAQGARKVQLMVRSTNEAAQGFYARLGYADQECTVLGRWLDEA